MNDKVILLVEDNPKDEALTLRALKQSAVANQVAVARDGVEAINYLFAPETRPAGSPAGLPTVVLLDLKLPRVDGLEVVKRIRQDERTKLLPVVILTSSNEEEDRIKGYGLGANSFVRKPVDFSEFAAAVRELGLYWLILNEAAPPG